jgi:chromosome segregation ATPase
LVFKLIFGSPYAWIALGLAILAAVTVVGWQGYRFGHAVAEAAGQKAIHKLEFEVREAENRRRQAIVDWQARVEKISKDYQLLAQSRAELREQLAGEQTDYEEELRKQDEQLLTKQRSVEALLRRLSQCNEGKSDIEGTLEQTRQDTDELRGLLADRVRACALTRTDVNRLR